MQRRKGRDASDRRALERAAHRRPALVLNPDPRPSLRHQRTQRLDLPAFARAEEVGEDAHRRDCTGGPRRQRAPATVRVPSGCRPVPSGCRSVTPTIGRRGDRGPEPPEVARPPGCRRAGRHGRDLRRRVRDPDVAPAVELRHVRFRPGRPPHRRITARHTPIRHLALGTVVEVLGLEPPGADRKVAAKSDSESISTNVVPGRAVSDDPASSDGCHPRNPQMGQAAEPDIALASLVRLPRTDAARCETAWKRPSRPLRSPSWSS